MNTPAPRDTSLGRIRRQLAERWPDACRSAPADTRAVLPTGIAGLDALLPHGGVPPGQWIEITGDESSGKTRLLFAWLATLCRQGTVGYLDFRRSFFPAAAAAAGVDTRRLLWAAPESPAAGVRMAEWFLRRGVVGVVFDLVGESRELPAVLCHRFRQETIRTQALALFLTARAPRLIGSSMVALRLEITRQGRRGIDIHVARGRIARTGAHVSWCVDGAVPTVQGKTR